MQAISRRKVGVLLALFAPVVLVVLALSGVRLIKMSTVHYADTGQTVSSTKFHWALAIPAGMLVGGIVLMVIPRREPPKI